ncbi:TerC family protein [Megalodesulfovibrio gigas]|uniref:TerC family protein n=1 Tax=Megalodesulfovibrio gigas TaxID=879 RepID=UPI00042391B7|nr:hypothetical protein [Megalodesulfovibrio gigas]
MAIAIAVGTGAAVFLRVALTVFSAKLMDMPYVKRICEMLISLIGVMLLVAGCPQSNCRRKCTPLFQALTTIIVADQVISTESNLAVASRSDSFMQIFGLGRSIPLVAFTSMLLTRTGDSLHGCLTWALSCWEGYLGEMIFTDLWTVQYNRLEASTQVAGKLGRARGYCGRSGMAAFAADCNRCWC